MMRKCSWTTLLCTTSARLRLPAIASLACCLNPASPLAAPTITYVQGNYAMPQTPQTTVNVTFTAAQVVGDLNVIAVGCNGSTGTVTAVTDKSGNTFTRVLGSTAISGATSGKINERDFYFTPYNQSDISNTNVELLAFVSIEDHRIVYAVGQSSEAPAGLVGDLLKSTNRRKQPCPSLKAI